MKFIYILIIIFCGILEPTLAQEKDLKELIEDLNNTYHGRISYNPEKLNPYPRSPIVYRNAYIRNPVPLEDEFGFSDLVEMIDAKQLWSIESVIEALPDYMKNDNYVLMYDSRSLQAATPNAPRALLYTPTAKFVLSFNGGGSIRGGNNIETVEFDIQTQKFTFREITFSKGKAPQISEPNPAACLECHQSPNRKNMDLRPNWDPYNTWIGAYGSNNGKLQLTSLREKFKNRIHPQDKKALDQQEQEAELLVHYIEDVKPHHPRYSLLGRFRLSAPKELSEHLAVWNFMRVTRLMREDTDVYETVKEALAAALQCKYKVKNDSEFAKLALQLQEHTPNLYYHYLRKEEEVRLRPIESVGLSINTLFESFGLDTSDWSMDFGNGGRFAFVDRFGTPGIPTNAFKYAISLVAPDDLYLYEEDCETLEATATKKLRHVLESKRFLEMRESRITKASATAADILKRCQACHSSGRDSVPQFSFTAEELSTISFDRLTGEDKSLLEKIIYRTSEMALKDEQMPPGKRLSPSERRTLTDYLSQLIQN